jgi:hypothetical protein
MLQRQFIAYLLIAALVAFGVGAAVFYLRRRAEQKRILRGGRPRTRK